MKNRWRALGLSALSLVAMAVSGFWLWHLRDPHLLPIRAYEPLLLCSLLAAGFAAAWPLQHGYLRTSLCVACVLLATWAVVDTVGFARLQQRLVSAPTPDEIATNRRFIVGFADFDHARGLARHGIAGFFLTRRNVAGLSSEAIAARITELQRIRREAGLAPLIIATDQEGGPVSRLSPPLARQPSLSSTLAADQPAQAAYDYGVAQGTKLAALGVNVNFSPVVDLRPAASPDALDFNTRIQERAISADPDTVIRIAGAYIRGLQSVGVTAVLKHFPGLRRADADTHHFAAHIATPVASLAGADWRPFAVLGERTDAWIMLAHVVLDAVDTQRPVSTSIKVVDTVLRDRLGFDGTLVTDDLTMGATYNRGFCQSVREALDAQVDYLLIAYDYDKYYDAIDCVVE